MIKRKLKPCKGCKTDKYIYGHGLCRNCYNRSKAKEYAKKRPARKPIRKMSDKYKAILKDYRPIRRKFLDENPYCNVRLKNCTYKAEVIHHTKGKAYRELYLDVTYWMASCSNCNLEIETLGKEAYDRGFKVRRTN